MLSRALLLCAVLALTSCRGGGGEALQAGVMVANFAVAGKARRAQGRCFNDCVAGTTCNRETGYCERLPCRGKCQPGDTCVESGLDSRCVRGGNLQFVPGSPNAGVAEPGPP